ncbi:nose resistant to fluoxetine protein 6-like [Onthophagus taurus]|uniref:nose resistant to fluoxetine protein 6-like n=1 Tax=Onthophagus taurus TaxID=166361 RepID=UPI0039BDFC67
MIPLILSKKQSLIMNQVVASYTLSKPNNELCANHSRVFKYALRAFKPWALKMFDSSSKFQPGVLSGNLMDFGAFRECLKIKANTQYGQLAGQHCTIKIQPTENIVKKVVMFRGLSEMRYDKIKALVDGASIYWSVCIPDSCPIEDILKHFTKLIKTFGEGLDLEITLNEDDCSSIKNEPKFGRNQYIFSGVLLSIILICLISTIIDVVHRRKNPEKKTLFRIFSLYSNSLYIFNYNNNNPTGFNCIDGIRYLSISYVVVGHRFMMTMFVPSVNALDLIDWLLRYRSTIIIGGTVSVDTFFMISGMLLTYHSMNHLSKNNGKLNWFFLNLYRFMRLTPPLAFIVITHITLIQFLGSGPLWKHSIKTLQLPCKYFWWSTLLHIQNYINPSHLCLVQAWYLTNDFLYYLFAPFLIYPLWKWNYFGWIIWGIAYILSVAINFYYAWINKYGAGKLVSNTLLVEDYFTKHYVVPHIRASTYILGIGLGAIFHFTRDKKIKMNAVTVTVGWMWCFILIITTTIGNHFFQLEDHEYNRLEASSFISLSRSGWTFGVMWIVWACKHGYGGPINYFLAHPIFQVLGKLTYSVFLLHLSIQFLDNGALKLPIYFSDFSLYYKVIGDLVLVTFFAVFYALIFECPFVRLARMLK